MTRPSSASPAAQPPRARATAQRRAQILEAALQCFTRQGVAATTIDDLRRRSGASIGSIYHHFGSKEEVAAALYVESLADYQRGMLAALEDHQDARAGIEAVVRYHLRWIVSHADQARFLFAGLDARMALAGGRELRRRNREFVRAVTDWVGPRQQAGELREVAPEVLNALWVGPSQELCRHWLEGRVTESPERAAGVLAEAAWKALGKE